MKKALLIGCGAEIGSLLVGMLDPDKDGFEISAVLTNPLMADANHPGLVPMDSLLARVVLAQPHLYGAATAEGETLIVNGNKIPIFFGDIFDYDLESLPGPFDVCIVATSKSHIGDKQLMQRFAGVATYIVGVAEALSLPALYPGLIGAPERHLTTKPVPAGDERIFALGSCQTNGWQAQLRGVLEMAEDLGIDKLEFKGLEVDIIHPDTPTGRLGTKSISARDQDPRNNFRPSFSQVNTSMSRMFPNSNNINTISLRTLTMPPGYQLCRFFFDYQCADGSRLSGEGIADSLRKTANKLPTVLHIGEKPYGSRGYEFCEAAAVVLPQSALLSFFDDPFSLGDGTSSPVSELITQAYVHNTRGYCRSVIEAIRHLNSGDALRVYEAMESNA
ncbi:MAG: hypothetical protein HOL37_09345 [Rhodospirillaceae bacterium]|nr:hypothetical protein [Rhodospirillaceae bacterium]MBT4219095.1 hypothetical protein [Rhodospirillaceae bacterium]MBT4463529.1 hypothetical protein [Rhodospirillaceae bacterium]MBT5014250.1 hypothetical protein [Rhodospirillaceae bacterium]MBT5309526.1 hypothetical protein [Rhodospirillaceae bacterium]